MRKAIRFILIAVMLATLRGQLAWAEGNDAPATQPADPGDSFAPGDTTSQHYAPIAKFWGPQSPADQATAVAGLKAYVNGAMVTMHHPKLALHETKYFLFYSDLTPSEAAKWAGLLDAMYDRVRSIFGIKAGDNIWRGKALIVVFFKPDDYRKFESTIEKTNPGNTIAMFHYFSNGRAYIISYRDPDQMKFAHLLVNQAVVGFLYRYKSPVMIPSWISYGLGEAIASDMVKDRDRPAAIPRAQHELSEHRDSLDNFFTAHSLQGWQMPVAQAMSEFMLKESRPNYAAFINGIKAGISVSDSLEKKYDCPQSRLVAAFGQYVGIKNLKE